MAGPFPAAGWRDPGTTFSPAGLPARRSRDRVDRRTGARPVRRGRTFKRFVSQLVALRLRQIVEADLAIRGGDPAAVDRLAEQAARLRDELKGLSVVLDPEWVEDLYDELGWISLEASCPMRRNTTG